MSGGRAVALIPIAPVRDAFRFVAYACYAFLV